MNPYGSLVFGERPEILHAHIVGNKLLSERLDREAAGGRDAFQRGDRTHALLGLVEIGVRQGTCGLNGHLWVLAQAHSLTPSFSLVPARSGAALPDDTGHEG